MSSDTAETITNIMELVAEHAGDITERVFNRYFELCSDSRALMDHTDEYMRGRMMTQVLLLLMEPGEEELSSYLEFETSAHEAYGVKQHMYENLLQAVREVVAETLGDAFDGEMDAALKARSAYLLEAIADATA